MDKKCGELLHMLSLSFLMISHADDECYIYSALRTIQTFVGVFTAWLINVKLFPYPRKKASVEE